MRTRRVGGVAMLILFLGSLVSWGASVVINEVAWAGTAANSADEWIELYNVSDEAVDLTGWALAFGDVSIDLGAAIDTVVEPGGYFLLERSDDETIPDIDADLIYKGSLSNDGVLIELLDQTGAVIDTANAGQETGWAAGNGKTEELPYATMERIDPAKEDTPTNWRSNNGTISCGHDAAGGALLGTPRAKNSATIVSETVPVVTVLSPTEDGTVIGGVFIISWTVTDPDGPSDQLRVDILLSADDGATWEPLVEGLVGGSYAWDTTALPDGGDYRLKVTATDVAGNVGEGISPIFSVSNPG